MAMSVHSTAQPWVVKRIDGEVNLMFVTLMGTICVTMTQSEARGLTFDLVDKLAVVKPVEKKADG